MSLTSKYNARKFEEIRNTIGKKALERLEEMMDKKESRPYEDKDKFRTKYFTYTR